MVECHLAKVDVEGSNPFSRSLKGLAIARLLAGVVLAAGAALGGCFTSKTCSLVGCQDQFHATVARADGSIPSGTHVMDVTADGVTIQFDNGRVWQRGQPLPPPAAPRKRRARR